MAVRLGREFISLTRLSKPAQPLLARFDALLTVAAKHGFQVDGLHLVKAFLTPETLTRLEQLVFNDTALGFFKAKSTRIEFIVEGPLPPELIRESANNERPVFKQRVGYDVCKGCRLCIQICPKQVYYDNGSGKPDAERRREEECTGPAQCGRCIDVCPEKAIGIDFDNSMFGAVVFLLLENPLSQAEQAAGEQQRDFYVANPLELGRPLELRGALNPEDLAATHRILAEANFQPVFEINGVEQHLVDSRDPVRDLGIWAKENGRETQLVLSAMQLLYRHLPEISGVKQGKYAVVTLAHRIIDEIIHAGIEMGSEGSFDLLQEIVDSAYVKELFLGARQRPIGGLLPTGTSVAWKTPYGSHVPDYAHLERCLGPECALCVTNCPEGSGGETAAIKMVPKVPLGTIASMIRGVKVFVLKLDGSHTKPEDMEELTGKAPFEFKVNADYCKSCGTCMTCCPHGVIESTARTFDLKELLA